MNRYNAYELNMEEYISFERALKQQGWKHEGGPFGSVNIVDEEKKQVAHTYAFTSYNVGRKGISITALDSRVDEMLNKDSEGNRQGPMDHIDVGDVENPK